MTPASSKTMIIWLEDRIDGLEKRLKEVERLNKPPTKLLAIPDVLRQAGYAPKPKPLTDEEVRLLIGGSVGGQLWLMPVVRAVEKAHGIGEKE